MVSEEMTEAWRCSHGKLPLVSVASTCSSSLAQMLDLGLCAQAEQRYCNKVSAWQQSFQAQSSGAQRRGGRHAVDRAQRGLPPARQQATAEPLLSYQT